MSVDLNAIKTAVKSILDTANTVGAMPFYLSQGLSTAVNKILTVNVERIPIQPSFFPCITMFYEAKNIQLQDIGANALNGKRRADVDLKIVGIVWVDALTTGYELKDLADNECENLMENIEQVLRSDATLQGTVNWSKPTNVTYHNFPIDESAHMRAGIINLRITKVY